MEIDVFSGDIEPGDMIIAGSAYGHQIGFYRGLGSGTIQFYTARYLAYKLKDPKISWSVSYQGGDYKNQRVAKYHPDLITDPDKRKEVEEAIEYIRTSEILPAKY